MITFTKNIKSYLEYTSKNCQRFNSLLILILLIICSHIFLFNYIPHGQSPDEFAHIVRASSLAHGHIILKEDTVSNQNAGEFIDKSLHQYYADLSYIPFHYEKKITNEVNTSIKKLRFSGDYIYCSIPTHAVYFPLSYLPQALAIFVGERFHLRIYKTIIIARILNLVSIIALLLAASYFYKLPLLGNIILLMPMSIFQFTSVSSDGLQYAILFLIISLFLNILHAFTYRKLIWMCIFIFIIVTHRFSLIVLCLLPFYLCTIQFSKKILFLSLSLLICSLGWIGLVMHLCPRPDRALSSIDSLIFYLQQPITTAGYYINTLTNKFMLDFMATSFVGKLGWLDYDVNRIFIKITWLLIISISLTYIIKFRIYKKLISINTLLICLSILSFFALLTCELIQWTTFPCDGIIQGEQGRHIILSFIILIYGLFKNKDIFIERYSGIITLVYGIASIYFTLNSTIFRYWIA